MDRARLSQLRGSACHGSALCGRGGAGGCGHREKIAWDTFLFFPYRLWYCGNGAGGENLGKKILEPFCKPSQLCWSSHRVFCKTYSLAVKAALCQPPSSCCLLHA